MNIYNCLKTRQWKKLIFMCLPLFIFLSFIEVLFRMTGLEPLRLPKPGGSPQAYFWICDKKLGFRNRVNGRYEHNAIKGNPLVTTDEFGFRNGFGWNASEDTPIILFIGDSTTFGAEVDDQYTITSEIAKQLLPKYALRVLNAGVRGYSTFQSKRMLEECLHHFPQIKMVVYTYCTNDYFENLNPIVYLPAKAPTVWWDENLRAITELEVENPSVRWGELIESAYTIPPNPRLRVTNFLRSHSAFLEFVGHRIRLLIGKKKTMSGLPIVSENHAGMEHGSIGPVNSLEEGGEQYAWAKKHHADDVMVELLRQMRILCEERDILFFTSAYSTSQQRNINQDVVKFCDLAGVIFFSTEHAFIDNEKSYMSPQSDGDYNPHYGKKGTETFAKALAPQLERELSLKLQQ